MAKARFIPLSGYTRYSEEDMLERARSFYSRLAARRTVRDFSDEPVPREVIEYCLRAAGTAPSGANRQPWYFVVVSNPELKKKIRQEAEKEERLFYQQRAPKEWLEALSVLGTTPEKPFLEKAPYLIAIFARKYEKGPEGSKHKNYYVMESVGIATGMLITALHWCGLATLTHTPSPMNFLNRLLGRPENEKPFLLLVTGYPAPNTRVPDIRKKGLENIAEFR
ncbi:MAG: nitroreductase family protein [Calditrichaeota bacterium]|nr:MAG: nitroreductase family protein [Calditrichota bacterium]